MKNTTYLQGAFILTLTNLITGILSFVYRIFLTRSIGAEGIGIYQLVLPLYYLFITLVSGGLVTSISKLVAENRVKFNYSNINKIIKVGIVSVSYTHLDVYKRQLLYLPLDKSSKKFA